ncbi:hypothetical protein KIAC18_002540 [Sporomusa sphaeroides]|uniref:hypothetical protein n=1 Tax=Sporomusa sphaeroides TaxID=47679 RepID=UPI003DA0D5FC
MENGAVAAEAMGLTIGVGLTAEQVTSLTSDIVWLEETINGQKVLVPEVYLSSPKAVRSRGTFILLTKLNCDKINLKRKE